MLYFRLMTSKAPTAALTREKLRTLAGDRAYERGEVYARDGRVGEIAEDGGHLTASVTGDMRYRTSLWVSGAKITYACTCPVGSDGACCKHCVALGLCWLDQGAGTGAATNRARIDSSSKRVASGKRRVAARPLTMKDVRAHLAALPTSTLVELVMQQAMEHDGLRQRLLLDAAKSSGGDVRIHTYRQALSAAIGTGEFVDYREAAGYCSSIHEVVSSIEQLTREQPAAVIDLVEHALLLMERALGHVDDSDGNAGEVIGRLLSLHLAACTRARPEPELLAQRLFDWEMRSDWEIFHGAVSRYAKVLGTGGLAHYRTLAEAEWSTVPAPGAGQLTRAFSGKRFRIASIMESLARMSGDVDAIAAVKMRDLSSAWAYLTIASLYDEAGQRDRAIDWAEQGIAAFPTRTDMRLREFLAAQYQREKRLPEAIHLLWMNFADHPSKSGYVALHTMAAPAGAWPQSRERAIGELRGRLEERKAHPYGGDASLLVEILLWEGNDDAAWSAAQKSGCNERLWMQLAKGRETSHPDDALTVYCSAVERMLSRKNNDACGEAVSTLRVIARVMKRTTIAGGFAGYLTELRARHKAKRNFIKMLDAARLWAWCRRDPDVHDAEDLADLNSPGEEGRGVAAAMLRGGVLRAALVESSLPAPSAARHSLLAPSGRLRQRRAPKAQHSYSPRNASHTFRERRR